MTRWTRSGLFELFRLNAAGTPVGEMARATGHSRAEVEKKLANRRASFAAWQLRRERYGEQGSGRDSSKISPRKRYLAAVRERLEELKCTGG